ncbi:hypothetical protein [uncultured Phascolarctobacterium sp.]|nr:hypothetical protein [uncultured Phascolarctobacterium sp.]
MENQKTVHSKNSKIAHKSGTFTPPLKAKRAWRKPSSILANRLPPVINLL